LLNIYGMKNIIYCDSQGIIHHDRTDLTVEKQELLNASTASPKSGALADAIKGADIFIGLSKPGLLTPDMVRTMADKPIIFAMANPTPEIMPDEAKAAGAFIVATGRSDFPNQANNSLVFPGAFKGMLDANIPQFKIEMFSDIAQAIADSVTDISVDNILPSMFDKNIVNIVAETIQRYK
jgi:malate dehydrogenase (oxaloacetate-decarboxylating)